MDGSPLVIAVGLILAFAIYVFNRLSELQNEQGRINRRLDLLTSGFSIGGPSSVTHPTAPPVLPRQTTTGETAPTPPPYATPVQPVQRPAYQSGSQTVHQASTAEVLHRLRPSQTPAPPPVISEPAEPDIESRMGGSWMARLGVIAIALGVGFLLQYAFPRIGPGERVCIGLTIGLVLYGAGQWLLRKPLYNVHAQVLSSGGIVVFFLSIYAAHSLYHLIGYWTALAVLVVPALLASILAVAGNTQSVAIFCVLGAFAAPVMLHSDQGAPDPAGLLRLYGYMAFLNLWVTGMVRFKPWYSLPALSLASTWVLFFTAGPIQDRGWSIEAFSGVFLLLSVMMGLQTLYGQDKELSDSAVGDDNVSDVPSLGVGIIIGGCVLFAAAGVAILGKQGILGWPAPAVVGMMVAVLCAGLSMGLPGLKKTGRTTRQILAYFSGVALLVVMGAASGLVGPVHHGQTSAAFGFAVFTFLLFLGISLMLSRRSEAPEPAAALLGSTAIVHLFMVLHVLDKVAIAGLPADCLSLPLAGWLTLLALKLSRTNDRNAIYCTTATLASLGLTLTGLLASPVIGDMQLLKTQHFNALGGALVGLDFLLVSATWIAMRGRLAPTPFRASLLGACGNAVVFYLLLWATTGMTAQSGVVLASLFAVAMAAYHAFVGFVVLRSEGDDRLLRLTYLGIAVTFITIAIPLQFREMQVTTLAWAVEGLMLVWAGLAAREPRARWYGIAVLTIGAGKALLLDLSATLPSFHFLFNSRMLAGASVVACAYLAAHLLWRRRTELTEEESPLVPWLIGAANLLTLVFVSVDLWEFSRQVWSTDGQGAAKLSLSLFWTLYAFAAVSVGIWKRIRPVRLFAMGLLYFSIFKVFLFDLGDLGQPYRIYSFLTLGVILVSVSLLYKRFEERLLHPV
jgi:uncharacterized membrane protein